jgi:hypothetical protein
MRPKDAMSWLRAARLPPSSSPAARLSTGRGAEAAVDTLRVEALPVEVALRLPADALTEAATDAETEAETEAAYDEASTEGTAIEVVDAEGATVETVVD